MRRSIGSQLVRRPPYSRTLIFRFTELTALTLQRIRFAISVIDISVEVSSDTILAISESIKERPFPRIEKPRKRFGFK
jgi:hypothetical protein